MKKGSLKLIALLVVICIQLSMMATVVLADTASETIVLTSGRSNYELAVNGFGSYDLTLPSSVTAGKITAVPNAEGQTVTVTAGGTEYSLDDTKTFAVAEGMEITIAVGDQTYTVKVILSVYEEVKSLIRTIESGKNVPAMLNALKPRYEALPDWAKDLIANRNLLGYEPAPAAADMETGKIVMDGGRVIYEIELKEGVHEYSQDVASSYKEIAVSSVPSKDGDAVALQAAGKSYGIGEKIPLAGATEIVITVSNGDHIIAYKVAVNLSINEEIKALNSGIAVLASTDIDLRFKGMVLPLVARYNALDEAAKSKVTNAQALLDAKATIDRLEKAAADIAAAAEKTIKDLNDGIAALSGKDLVLGDEALVSNLLETYDLLTTEQKEKIENYSSLQAAAEKMNVLKAQGSNEKPAEKKDGAAVANPKTSDSNNVGIYAALCVLSLLSIVVLIFSSRKTKNTLQS